MTINKKTFSVSLMGVSDADKNILKRTFSFTTSLDRVRSYRLLENVVGETPDIIIVNADDATAMHDLALSGGNQGQAGSSIIHAAKVCPPDVKYFIRRPWFASRILKTLDEVSIHEMDFIPELTIGDTAQESIPDVVNTLLAQPIAKEEGIKLLALVIDDSLPIRRQVEIELRLAGISAELVASGEQALEQITKKKYDVVFLDVMMPGINGYQTCKAIKADLINKTTPVIMLTGKSSSFDRVKGKFAGCNSYITKPVGRNEFQEVIQKYLPHAFEQAS